MSQIAVRPTGGRSLATGQPDEQFVTLFLDKHMFGVSVLRVQDVIIPDRIAMIPLAPPEVMGAINLRGRIVTVIDLRARVGLSPADRTKQLTSVTVPVDGELYSLCVDSVGDVLTVASNLIEPLPPTVDSRWRHLASSVVRLETGLMTLLDIDRVIEFVRK